MKNCYNNIFESGTEDEGCERIRLGKSKGGGAAMLWPVMFQCTVVWISTALPSAKDKHIHLTLSTLSYHWIKFRLAPNFPEFKYSESRQVFAIRNSKTSHVLVGWSSQREWWVGGLCGTSGGKRKCIQFFGGETCWRRPLGRFNLRKQYKI